MNDILPGVLAPEYAERFHLIAGIAPHGSGARSAEEGERLAAFDAPMGEVRLPACNSHDIVVAGPHGPVPVRVYTAPGQGSPRQALVWLHGGAFLVGDLETPEADHTARYVAGTTGCPVVSVDYRLAVGGVHHPVPEDDCVAAYRWVRHGGLGDLVDPERIAIGGASAGACLAAAVALREGDAGAPPWQLLLVYPTVHSQIPQASAELASALEKVAGSPLRLSPGSMVDVNENYIGGPLEHAKPYAFPGDAADLSGLPPTFIENCEFDDLRASGEQFARQLAAAGVDVEQTCAGGVPHGHLSIPGSRYAYRTMQHLCDRMAGNDSETDAPAPSSIDRTGGRRFLAPLADRPRPAVPPARLATTKELS